MKMIFIKDVKKLEGKRVLVRADFNVPVKDGKVADNFKIEKSLATIKYLLDKRARIILVSHIGRPEGFDKNLSLAPVARELEKLLKEKVSFKTLEQCEIKNEDNLTLLENIRFYKEEEKNDVAFARRLSKLADVFVLDGFAVAHRPSASVVGVAKFLPAYGGFLMNEEISALDNMLSTPKRPFVSLLGGAKAETKIPIFKNLLKISDNILVGGAIFNSYLFAKGFNIGDSVRDEKCAKDILRYCKNKKTVLPIDVVVGKKDGSGVGVVKIDKTFHVDKGECVYDVGPETIGLFSSYINKAGTILWNGAFGYFEQKPYEKGTFAIAKAVASADKKAFSVCGGGETVEILRNLHLSDKIDLISTGGGAMLEFLSGKVLPGVKIIKNN